jgi:hypothetical protein
VIAQLTHLRPRPGELDRVLALLEEWGRATRDDAHRPGFTFLSRDEDHLFLVALYPDAAGYEAGARAAASWLARLMPLLADGHGPTYCGPVLAHEGGAGASGMPLPAAVKVGHRRA